MCLHFGLLRIYQVFLSPVKLCRWITTNCCFVRDMLLLSLSVYVLFVKNVILKHKLYALNLPNLTQDICIVGMFVPSITVWFF
jgi:hypothetical protein